MQRLAGLALLVFLLTVSPIRAFERFEVVSTTDLRQMLDQRDNGTIDFTLLNTLDEIIFRHQSIPGSINIPWSTIATRHKELGPDKDKLVISYCIGHR